MLLSMLWRGRVRLDAGRHIELSIHVGFVLTLLGVAWLLAEVLFPRLFPGWTGTAYWVVAAAVALTDSLAGLLHELGHAVMALARGRHVYGITLYGVAAAVRRSGGASQHHRDQLLIAIAGPASHLLFAAALWATWQWLPLDNQPLHVALGFSAVSNFAVGLLNLVPVLPLDGARAAKALVGLGLRG
jgi:Zn-dependent protease